MKIIQSVKNKTGWSFFLCPFCNGIVEKRNQHGKKAKSCGCMRHLLSAISRTKHKEGKTRLYQTYINMKRRCYYKKDIHYKYYGERNITVCDEWRESYLNFRDWALKNGYSDNLTIDRKDNDGNYTPGNCRFIPLSVNNLNRRTVVLDFEKAQEIRNKYSTGLYTQAILGQEYGVSHGHISEIVNNKTWIV